MRKSELNLVYETRHFSHFTALKSMYKHRGTIRRRTNFNYVRTRVLIKLAFGRRYVEGIELLLNIKRELTIRGPVANFTRCNELSMGTKNKVLNDKVKLHTCM